MTYHTHSLDLLSAPRNYPLNLLRLLPDLLLLISHASPEKISSLLAGMICSVDGVYMLPSPLPPTIKDFVLLELEFGDDCTESDILAHYKSVVAVAVLAETAGTERQAAFKGGRKKSLEGACL